MKLTTAHTARYGLLALLVMSMLNSDQSSNAAYSAAAVTAVPGTQKAATRQGSLGVFLDHNGDGAIELRPCGEKLCGHVVWLREGAPPEACGKEIIGDVVPVRDGVWDGGWILDPEADMKFDVEISRINDEEIQVMGYLGSKDLSETFVWKKAPASLAKCTPPEGLASVHGT